MEIAFGNRKLRKQLMDPQELSRAFGTLARKDNQRINELSNADHLGVLKTLPAAGCHELKGERKGEFAVSVSSNFRIIFEPNQSPLPRRLDE